MLTASSHYLNQYWPTYVVISRHWGAANKIARWFSFIIHISVINECFEMIGPRLLCYYALAMMIYTCWIEAFPHSNANGAYVFGQQTQSKQHIDCSNSPPMSMHITIEVDLYNHLSGTLLVNSIHDIDLVKSKLRDIFHRNFRIEKNLNNLIFTIIFDKHHYT